MPTTTISVIVTCYNYRDFVAEAVDGVLAQKHPATQLIVVDDGSSDGSTQLLRERYGTDPRVTLLTGENGGQLAAFQRGLAVATGDVICFLDADDRWAPDYLGRLAAFFDEHRETDFVLTDVRLFGDDNRMVAYADRPMDLGYTVISTYMTGHWYGAPTSALALRRDWAERCLDLPESFRKTWRISADNCLVYGTSVLGGRKYFLPTGCVQYRTHGNNGWWSKRTVYSNYLNRLRSMGLIRHYAKSMGLDEHCVEHARHELRTKPNPSWEESRRYAQLTLLRRGRYLKNLQRAGRIMARAWRNRASAPVEFPGL